MNETVINSIEIPADFIEFASGWYDGSSSMLYAIASTGGLTTGSVKPHGCETEEEWYHMLWRDLSLELFHLIKQLEKGDDINGLELANKFYVFADDIDNKLYAEYGIEEE